MDTLREGLKRLGTSAHLFSPAFFRKHLEEAGFVDVEVYTYKVPWGAWPKNKKSKEIGRFCQEVFTSGMPVPQTEFNGECLRILIVRRRGVCVPAYDSSSADTRGQGQGLVQKLCRYFKDWQRARISSEVRFIHTHYAAIGRHADITFCSWHVVARKP